MEMQFFILGHVILLAICINISLSGYSDKDHEIDPTGRALWLNLGVYFILLEIIYWILHWVFVP